MKLIGLIILSFCVGATDYQDCIFNNDFKTLTQAWINESSTNYSFIWIEEENSYFAKLSNEESIWVSKGGCNHFAIILTYKTTKSIDLDDKDYWLNKTIELSTQFKLDFFLDSVNQNSSKLEFEKEGLRIYSISTSETESRISEGVIVEEQGRTISLILSYYIN